MTNNVIPIPQGASIGQGLRAGSDQVQSGATPLPPGASIGHPEEGITYGDDGSFTITPKEGESFADTMNRAARIGNSVSPQMVNAQTRKGIAQAPTVLGAAAMAGPLALAPVALTAGGTAAVPAGAGFAGAQLVDREAPSLLIQGAKAAAQFVAAHPGIKTAAYAAGGGAALSKLYKLSKLLGLAGE